MTMSATARARLLALVDRLGPWPGILLGAAGSGLLTWSLLELAKGL